MTRDARRVRSGMPAYVIRAQREGAIALLQRGADNPEEPLTAGATALGCGRDVFRLAAEAYVDRDVFRPDTAAAAAQRCAEVAQAMREGWLPLGYVPARVASREQVAAAARAIAGDGDVATLLALDALREDPEDPPELTPASLPDGWELAT